MRQLHLHLREKAGYEKVTKYDNPWVKNWNEVNINK